VPDSENSAASLWFACNENPKKWLHPPQRVQRFLGVFVACTSEAGHESLAVCMQAWEFRIWRQVGASLGLPKYTLVRFASGPFFRKVGNHCFGPFVRYISFVCCWGCLEWLVVRCGFRREAGEMVYQMWLSNGGESFGIVDREKHQANEWYTEGAFAVESAI
jgi:hypothetical protein